nr:hypothetical protein [Tanacetum cinerariifolium]
MGCLPRSALFFITESLSLTRSLNLVVHGERVKIRGNIKRNVTTKIVLHTVTIHLEIRTIRSQNSHKPDHEARSTHLVEAYDDQPCSAKTKKHDDKTKKEAKGKSHVELSTGVRNLSKEFEDFSDNNINEDNAASTLVPVVGQLQLTTLTPLVLLVLLILFLIPTTRVHKDHHVTQIIGDLSSAPQTRSITRMVKEQGGLTQIHNDDFHTCIFACFLSQEESKRVHQALKDPSWIEAMQEELLQFKMQKMDVKSAFLYGTIKEEVYVCQPLGFEDPNYPDKRGKIDQTLFIKKQKGDILLVQVYVDASFLALPIKTYGKSASTSLILRSHYLRILIVRMWMYIPTVTPKASHLHAVNRIFSDYAGASLDRKSITEGCQFLGLQVKQKQDGIFISQDKYVAEIMRKFGLTDEKSASTPIDIKKPLLMDPDNSLPNAKIFTELERMGYEKPSTKLTFYKAFSRLNRRKGFSRVNTPLFEGMLVQQQAANNVVTKNVPADDVDDVVDDDVIDDDVADDKIAQALEITKLKQRVRRLEKKRKLRVSGLKRLKKVGTAQKVKSSADTVMDDQEDASKQGEIIAEIDAD